MATREPTAGPDRVIVLAGGAGARLWPWTGPELPKPLLPLGGGGRTLLGATLGRLTTIAAPAAIRVLAPPEIVGVLSSATPQLEAAQFWSEPSPRDTGPAIAFAMRHVLTDDPAAVVVVAPADHRVEDEGAFCEALLRATRCARDGWLVTLGVSPDRPSTRFGYVECGDPLGAENDGVRRVDRFVEKPDGAAAERLVRAGALWNAGLFVWRADAFWTALERFAPGIAGPVGRAVAGAEAAAWGEAERTSIDYALMERADRVAVAPLRGGWDDVGGWDSVLALAARGEAGAATTLEVRGDDPAASVVLRVGPAQGEFAVVLGSTPLLVVVGPRGVLVSPRDGADRVKQFASS